MPPYTEPPLMNASDGITPVLSYMAGQIPMLPNLILLTLFFIIALSGIGASQRRTGKADYMGWFVIASVITLVVGIIMFLIDGFLPLFSLVVITVVSIMMFFVYFILKSVEQSYF